MKTICFLSNAYKHLFPSNTSTQFQSSIDISLLDCLNPPLKDNIEFCIKSISLYLGESITEATNFGVRSTLCLNPVIRGTYADNVVCMFTIEKTLNPIEVKITLNNSFFLSTTKHLISNACFEIINLKTNTVIPSSSIKETIIEVFVKSSSFDKMKRPFSMLLQSDEEKSLQIYQHNNNMKFSIELPQRKELVGDWSVVLKGLTMTSNIANVQENDLFYISLFSYADKSFTNPPVSLIYYLPAGFYSKKIEMINPINTWLEEENIHLKFEITRNNRVKLKRTNNNYDSYAFVELTLSSYLSIALGFENETVFNPVKHKDKTAQFVGNLNIGIPTDIMIKCDLIYNTLVGNRSIKMLRYITNFNSQLNKSIINFQFKDIVPCMIENKSFSKIQFEFCTVNDDRLILARNDHHSFIHLLFVNLN